MKLTLNLSIDDIRRLAKLVHKDLDAADKHALDGLLGRLAEMANVCDEYGNPLCSLEYIAKMGGGN